MRAPLCNGSLPATLRHCVGDGWEDDGGETVHSMRVTLGSQNPGLGGRFRTKVGRPSAFCDASFLKWVVVEKIKCTSTCTVLKTLRQALSRCPSGISLAVLL